MLCLKTIRELQSVHGVNKAWRAENRVKELMVDGNGYIVEGGAGPDLGLSVPVYMYTTRHTFTPTQEGYIWNG